MPRDVDEDGGVSVPFAVEDVVAVRSAGVEGIVWSEDAEGVDEGIVGRRGLCHPIWRLPTSGIEVPLASA